MRRIATVTDGMRSAIEARFSKALPGMKISRIDAPRLINQVKRTKNQYSRRDAVPSILKYLLRVAILRSRKFCMEKLYFGAVAFMVRNERICSA